jgi:hypothetical protein
MIRQLIPGNPQRLVGAVLAGAFVALVAFPSAQAQCLSPRGDLNGDGATNVLDIQCGIYVSLLDLEALVEPPACLGHPISASDIDCDGNINVTDMLVIVQLAVNLPLNPELDGDDDGCPDACQVPGTLEGGIATVAGTSTGPSWKLHALGNGFESPGKSDSTSFSLRPLAVGVEPASE